MMRNPPPPDMTYNVFGGTLNLALERLPNRTATLTLLLLTLI